MAWQAGIDRNYTLDERKAKAKWIEDNGLETWSRFQPGDDGRAAAQRFAAKVQKLTGVRMTVYETYSSSIKI